MKLDRLLSIVMLFLYRCNSTVAELPARFLVSQRTIYQDLESLDLAGFPIVSSVGRGNSIGLLLATARKTVSERRSHSPDYRGPRLPKPASFQKKNETVAAKGLRIC